MKRFTALEEIAALVTYIASSLASSTTGEALRVDGGVVKSTFKVNAEIMLGSRFSKQTQRELNGLLKI